MVLTNQVSKINEVVEIEVGSVVYVVCVTEVDFSDSSTAARNEGVNTKLGDIATDRRQGTQLDSSSESDRRKSLGSMDDATLNAIRMGNDYNDDCMKDSLESKTRLEEFEISGDGSSVHPLNKKEIMHMGKIKSFQWKDLGITENVSSS
ncbi:hypothetical protein V6N13_029142 [Hibiscus sabdariffa]|uniref:Uncharacterized protein n=2 Tax=Hibiscus sabdariffa TaxID=183260 RepID=A0ABR2ARW4_9ROSI